MANEELQNLLKSGIEAARGGNKAVARRIFEQVLRDDPQNELAWMWLATVLENPTERRKALQRVLSINPNNDRAKQALAKLQPLTQTEAVGQRAAAPAEPKPPVVEEKPRPEPQVAFEELRPPARSRSSSPSLLYMVAFLVAAILIILAVVLIAFQLRDEESEPQATQVVAPPIVIETSLPPTIPFATLPPGAAEGVDLGPTWTPSPTQTIPSSATPSPTSLPLGGYQIIFTGADNPVGLRTLQIANADGSNIQTLNVNLDPARVQVNVPQNAPVVVATETPSGIAATEEATAETSDGTAEASEPTLYENLEFLDPAVSPDGTLLAFTAQLAENVQEIFIMPLPSGSPRQLTTLGASETGGAVWSPDGTRLAFHSNQRDDFDVYLINADGGEPTNLTPNNSSSERDPSFDPSNTARILIASDQATPGELEIFALPLGSGTVEQLTSDVNGSFTPAVSPDGKFIAFISNRGGDNDLYVMNADGSNERLVSRDDENADDFSPAWSPDGLWILVSSDREGEDVLQLWAAKPDGSEWVRITDGSGPSQDGVWNLLSQ